MHRPRSRRARLRSGGVAGRCGAGVRSRVRARVPELGLGAGPCATEHARALAPFACRRIWRRRWHRSSVSSAPRQVGRDGDGGAGGGARRRSGRRSRARGVGGACPRPRRGYLAVPAARDGGDGLVVDDLPLPGRGAGAGAGGRALRREALPAVEQPQSGDVLEQFFYAFLAGRSADFPKDLVPSGRAGRRRSRMATSLAGIAALVSVGPLTGRERTVPGVAAGPRARRRTWRMPCVTGSRWCVAIAGTWPRFRGDGDALVWS